MTSFIGKLVNRTPVAYTSRTAGGPFTGGMVNNTESQMRAYGGVSTLFSIVFRISDAVAQTEWRLYRDPVDRRRTTATGEEQPRTEIVRHAALNLLNHPNKFMTRQDLVEQVQQHLDLTGEGWLVVVRDGTFGIPIELWPVRPDRMSPVPHPTEFLAGYLYHGPNGEQVPLGVDDVIQLKYPNPLDPYRGLGPVQAAMVDLDSARYSAEWNRNFFLNSAEPGGHLETDHNIEDDDFKRLQTQWREQHQGVSNAHRVAILEGGVKWKERQITMRDMQFTELRKLSSDKIREAFAIHAHMLGISEDVNKANAFAGERSFAQWLVEPRARRWKQALNHKLLAMFRATGQGVKFDHDRVVPEDREADDRERVSKAQAAHTLVIAGYAPDEVARVVGLPDMTFTERADAEPATPGIQRA